MSTILKALDKKKHSQQSLFIEQSSDRGWKFMITAALLFILLLLIVVVVLLFKTMTDKPTIVEKIGPVATLISTNDLNNNVPVKAKNVSLVSEVNFETIPLPSDLIAEQESEQQPALQQWISADKPVAKEFNQIDNLAEGVTVGSTANNSLLGSATLDDVSDDLQRRFALAVEQESNTGVTNYIKTDRELVASDIAEMPAKLQFQVPIMRYDSHMYSSDPKDRWIRINGVDLRVGDHLGDVELVDILPQQSVFRLGKQSFTLESLKDWKG